MEAINDQSACPASTRSKLRYPLRSASRAKEGMPATADASTTSSKRGRPSPCVSKSVDVLNISDKKDKSLKPTQRHSNPTKSAVSPRPAPIGSRTPISEPRMKRANTQGRSGTPVSEISSTSRRKFNVLTSVSYWLTQIKFSESASKHSISLGFFKLALESGCEPLQRMREELKSYACRHNLVAELGEQTKDLLNGYNILDDFQQLKISQNVPQLLEKGEHASKKDAPGPSAGAGNLISWSLNSETLTAAESNKKQRVQKRIPAATNTVSKTKNQVQPVSAKGASGSSNTQKKSQRPSRVVSNNGKLKNSNKKSIIEKVDPVDPLPTEEASSSHEDKENMDVVSMDVAMIQEVIETS